MWPLGSDHSMRPRRSTPADQRGHLVVLRAVDAVDDQSARRGLVHGAQPLGRRRRPARDPAAAGGACCGAVACCVDGVGVRRSFRIASGGPAERRPRRLPRRRRGLACSPSDTQAIVAAGGTSLLAALAVVVGLSPVVTPEPQAHRTCRRSPCQAPMPSCWPPPRRAAAARRRPARARPVFADAGHELYLVGGSVRDALLRPAGAPIWTSPPMPGPTQMQKLVRPWADALWDTGIEFGTVGVAARRRRAGDHHVPRRPLRPGVAQTGGAFGDRLEDDLVRRDFTVNAMAVASRRPARRIRRSPTAVWPHCGRRAGHARRTPEVSFGDDPLRMLRAARFVSQLGFAVAPRVREAMTRHGRRSSAGSPPSGWRPSWTSCCWAPTRSPGIELMVQTGLGDVVLPEVGGDAHGDRRAPPAQGRLRALADRAAAGHRPRRPTARTWCCGGRRCCTTSASRPPAGSSPAAGSASTTTRWSARR